MNDERLFELLATHAGPAAVDDDFDERLYAILERETRRGRSSRPALLLVAALVALLTVTAAIAMGSGLVEPPWVIPSPIPSPGPTTALLPCVEFPASPTGRLFREVPPWNPTSPTDWPGPLREEPTNCTPVVLNGTFVDGDPATNHYFDPPADASPQPVAWVDIIDGEFREGGCYAGACVTFDLAAPPPLPLPSPPEEWIAYGIVVDNTGDGRPDLRYGIDNMSYGEAGKTDLRIWIADLATGTTSAARCCQTGGTSGLPAMDVFWPRTNYPLARGWFSVPISTGDVFRFYVWASVIRDGEVVSTDYAPDFGWLEWKSQQGG